MPLDIFINMLHNKGITNKLDAWLTFFASDSPNDIIMLLNKYPEFRSMYDDIYVMCLNVERVMNMFSKELAELDRNTVQYMIDEMQDEIDGMQSEINGMKEQLNDKDSEINKKDNEIALLRKQLEELKSKG